MITEKTPDQLKLAFALWTRRAVCELMESEFGLRMPVRTCGEYLRRWGFTPQKPARRAYEQNPKEVRRWMEETYPGIAAQAKAQEAEIHWGDETGVRSDCQHGRCYAPKGQTPVIRLTARRFSVNMISTVTNQGKVRWMIYRDTLTSQVFIRFLERLIQDAGRKVLLIVDNLKVHHSRPVKEWLREHKDQIEVFYLPSYSPERNPDEYLNGDLKASLGNKRPPRDRQQLETNLKSHMHRLSKSPNHVGSYFQNQYVRYAA
jgi:transposase